MKRTENDLHFDKAELPMPKDCYDALMNAARSVKEEEPMKRASFRAVLIAAIILIATTAAAFAAQQLGWIEFLFKQYDIAVPQTAEEALCRAQDVHYCVLKNRLVLKALQEKGIEGLDHLLEGPNAFVFGMKDAVSAPKVINDFIEKKKLTSLEIRGGLLDSKAVDVQTIKSLAALPSREVLLAKLLGSMTNAIGSFVRVVEAYRKQKAGE